jgi:alpha-L-fucosidase
MNRRHFLTTTATLTLAAAHLPKALAATPSLALPTPDQVAWQDLEIGMFVHFAPNTWQDVESDNLSTPLSEINPAKLDTDQWAQTALALGARYIVFVAKHQGGFCMWQTQTTDYSIRNTPWKNGKGDVLADVVASCRKYSLKLGVYVCPRDDHFGARTGGICKTPELQARYDTMYRQQLTEVLTRYGPIVEVWFDGSTVTPVGDILHKCQPHAMVFQGPQATIRWVGNENGAAPYPCWNALDEADARSGSATSLNSTPTGNAWMPSEVDVSIRRPDWFWSTKNANKVLTLDQLLSVYYRSVGRGAQLLLNIPANRDGLLSTEDATVAKAFGDEIRRRFTTPIAATKGTGSTVTLHLPQPSRVDTVILQEEIAHGERVRDYRLEGLAHGTWQPLATGSAIGHKHIQPIDPVTIQALRLTVTRSPAPPRIRTLAAYAVNTPPPPEWDATPKSWAANLVGTWTANTFTLNLTKNIKAAAQYRLYFIPKEGSVTAIEEVVLKLHGVPNPNLIKPLKGQPNSLILDITGVAETVELSGRIAGASSGEILLKKL